MMSVRDEDVFGGLEGMGKEARRVGMDENSIGKFTIKREDATGICGQGKFALRRLKN